MMPFFVFAWFHYDGIIFKKWFAMGCEVARHLKHTHTHTAALNAERKKLCVHQPVGCSYSADWLWILFKQPNERLNINYTWWTHRYRFQLNITRSPSTVLLNYTKLHHRKTRKRSHLINSLWPAYFSRLTNHPIKMVFNVLLHHFEWVFFWTSVKFSFSFCLNPNSEMFVTGWNEDSSSF